MNIVVLTGSHHRKGTSALLADEFIRGIEEGDNEVFRFDAAFKDVADCLGCDVCGCGFEPCVLKDDMYELYAPLEKADIVVFVTPLYYYSMTGRMKTVIDRFYAINRQLKKGAPKRCVLLTTCADASVSSLNNVIGEYGALLDYLGWQDGGQVLGTGCWKREDAEASEFPQEAYELGRSLA